MQDFVPEHQRAEVISIMEVCGMDMAEAYQLFLDCGEDANAAIQTKLALTRPPSQDMSPESYSPQLSRNVSSSSDTYDHDIQYERYRIFKENGGATFSENYSNAGTQQRFLSGIIKKIPFFGSKSAKKNLEEFINRATPFGFNFETPLDALREVSEKNFPLIVWVFSMKADTKDRVNQLLSDQKMAEYLNMAYRQTVVFPEATRIDPCLQPFLKAPQDVDYAVVLRVNICKVIEVVGRHNYMRMMRNELFNAFKADKSKCIQLELQQAHLERRYRQEMNGNMHYEKPKSVNEIRKIQEDRKLRRIQEEEYAAVMRQVQDQHHEEKVVQQVQANSTQLLAKRKEAKAKMVIYSEGVQIKLRLPSGENLIIHAAAKEKVQYLFDFVMSSEPGEYGFEDDISRNFDIKRPYDRLSLKMHLGKTLEEVFEGSTMESLIVSEE